MKKNVIVTLADESFIDQAKQLFSSIYFNAKWKGDCLLLTNKMSKSNQEWFEKRGILIKVCQWPPRVKYSGYPKIVGCKLFLFHSYMKKWNKIIYLDADIIVRKPLTSLTHYRGFYASPEKGPGTFEYEILDPITIFQKIKKKILFIILNKHTKAFNSGVLVFDSAIIDTWLFPKLYIIALIFGSLSKYGEQALLNIEFMNGFKKLPNTYNYFPKYHEYFHNVNLKDVDEHIIHFVDNGPDNKPWNRKNHFYPEWKRNLRKSDKIIFLDNE